eukprot:11155059-Lingulodinium_polyedra.AAC.1
MERENSVISLPCPMVQAVDLGCAFRRRNKACHAASGDPPPRCTVPKGVSGPALYVQTRGRVQKIGAGSSRFTRLRQLIFVSTRTARQRQ